MSIPLRRLWPCVVAPLLLAAGPRTGGAQDGPEKQLLLNPSFEAAEGSELPEAWTPWTPLCQQASCTVRSTSEGLRVEAPGRPYGVGGVWQDLQGIEGGQAYAIAATCRAENVPSPFQALHVRLTWTRNGKLLHPAGMLVRGPFVRRNMLEFKDVLVAPREADGARLCLEVKWPRGGSVCWRRARVRPGSPPASRRVRIGTVFLRPRRSTPQKNLELFCKQIAAAGKLELDVVCLGEAITLVGTSCNVRDTAEPIPGPSTARLGRAARENRLWVVAGLSEREEDRVYNTAVLLDRSGNLAGKYRKVHLPREEWKKGITPGHEYPVFKTDFGTVAIQICVTLQRSEVVLGSGSGGSSPVVR